MTDNPYTHENVLAVTFTEHSSAYEALSRLKELDAKDDVTVREAAVVVREEDGKLVTKEEIGGESWDGTASGGLIGLLIGVIGGPFGVLVGGATGLLVGSLFDEDDEEASDSVLADISKSITTGAPALLADVLEADPVVMDAAMANLGGTVLRRSALDLRTEIAAAEEAQREAKKKARKELREARKQKQEDEVNAKLAALKAKLPRHKESAATS